MSILRYTNNTKFLEDANVPRFFVGNAQINEGVVTVTGSDAHHISRSLRMAVGDHVTVIDSACREYDCVLTDFLEDSVRAAVVAVKEPDTEPPCHITLYQALPKGDKLDTVIQKAVECGVCHIVPFESERCVVRAKPEAEDKKQQRRARIALEAAKQCGRGLVPAVDRTVGFREMLSLAERADAVLFCYEGEGTAPIGKLLATLDLKKGMRLALVIGSEGGFALSEAEAARERGFLMTGLGKRILRTETAPLFALAAISVVTELS